MKILEILAVGCLIYFIVYVILGIVAYNERYQRRQVESNTDTISDIPKKQVKQVEVVIKDGTWENVQIENINDKIQILELQAEDLRNDINKCEQQLQAERLSPICNDITVNKLIKQSLKLQAKKNDIETKIIKYNQQVVAIATKYYKENMC